MTYPDNSRALNDDHLQPPEETGESSIFGIEDARVNWMEKWGNLPHLEILVDKVYETRDFHYERKKGKYSDLYWATRGGQVSFFAYNEDNQNGFGGYEFHLQGTNLETFILKGPWTSRSSYMNRSWPHSIEVSLTSDPEAFKQGFTFQAGYTSIPMALDALDLIHLWHGESYALVMYDLSEENAYEIVKIDRDGDKPAPVFKRDVPKSFEIVYPDSVYHDFHEPPDDDGDRWYSEQMENQDFAQDDELSNGGHDIL